MRGQFGIFIILLVASLLYFFRLDQQSLWLDEAYSWKDALSLDSMNSLSRPAYYLLLHGWLLVSESSFWMRSLSIVFALGSLILIYAFGSRVGDRKLGLVSAVLLGLSPLFIRHAQEVRMYMLGTFLSLVGSYGLCLYGSKASSYSMGAWALGRILGVLSLPLTAFLFVSDFFILRNAEGTSGEKLKRIIIFLILICSILPFGIFLMRESSSASQLRVFHFSMPSLGGGLQWLMGGLGMVGSLYFLNPWANILIKGMMGLYLGLLLFFVFQRKQMRAIYPEIGRIELWAYLPLLAFILVSLFQPKILAARYIFFIHPYIIILLSAACIKLWTLSRPLLLGMGLVYSLATVLSFYFYYTEVWKEDWRGVGSLLDSKVQVGDRILVVPGSPGSGEGRCYRGAEALEYYYRGAAPLLCARPSDSLETLLKLNSRIWMVIRETHVEGAPDFGILNQESFLKKFQLAESYSLFHLRLLLVKPVRSN